VFRGQVGEDFVRRLIPTSLRPLGQCPSREAVSWAQRYDPDRHDQGAEQEAAEVLKRVVERIDKRQVAAPGWYRERLVGAVLALDPKSGVAAGSSSPYGGG
jgi:hypothetical protein